MNQPLGSEPVGIIWALGDTNRLGKPAALMDAGGRSFLARIISSLRGGGCQALILVHRDDRGPVPAAATAAGIQAVPISSTPDPFGVLSVLEAGGVRIGPPASTDPRVVILHPVDRPLLKADTVAHLIARFLEGDPPLLRPSFRGEAGFPVLLRPGAVDPSPSTEGSQDSPSEDLEVACRQWGKAIHMAEVDDQGVTTAIDSVPAYRRHFPRSFRKRFQKW